MVTPQKRGQNIEFEPYVSLEIFQILDQTELPTKTQLWLEEDESYYTTNKPYTCMYISREYSRYNILNILFTSEWTQFTLYWALYEWTNEFYVRRIDPTDVDS